MRHRAARLLPGFALVFMFRVGLCPGALTEAEVSAANVNLRAAADINSEVVAQASSGDVLQKTGVAEGDWTQVVPPVKADLWVYGELVRDGVVAVDKLRVRCGPGISYRSVGRLGKGSRVTVRGEQGDWMRVAPPQGTHLWINSKFLRPVGSSTPAPVAVKKPTTTVAPEPVVRPTPVKPVTPPSARPPVKPSTSPRAAPEPEQPAHARSTLVSSADQGRSVELTGLLLKAELVWRRPSPYKLVQKDAWGKRVTLCYVGEGREDLKALIGETVAVRGREYYLQGVRYPLVVPDRVTRR